MFLSNGVFKYPRHWKPETGTARQYLAVALKPYARRICRNIINNTSNDLEYEIDVRVLKEHEDIVLSLVMLDPRGGYYCNADLVLAVLQILRSEEQKLRK